MNGLRLHMGNPLERLGRALAKSLERPLTSPLDPEIIVVQSKGMGHWLSMKLARYHGVCANIRFIFPNAFVHEIFSRVIPDLPKESPFEPEVMTWRIMKRLPEFVGQKGFEAPAAYLADGRDELKLFQLSGRIADTFDQYLLFRPEMMLSWEKGEEDHWQAIVWRDLVKSTGSLHRAGLAERFFRRIQESSFSGEDLPERVSVFGISALPPFHIRVLGAIAGFREVGLFFINPCREYWGDIFSEQGIMRRVQREKAGLTQDDLHLERGNTLLASMGLLGRDFFDLIAELSPTKESPEYQDPGRATLLSCVQSDILNLREASVDPEEVRGDDRSIQIHSCHSPMREIQVLHDQILAMFHEDPSLLPSDILVMAPDIERHAPFIEAIFGTPEQESQRIPFTLADRTLFRTGRISDPFFRILNLPKGRLGASEVLCILESELVFRRFGLSEGDLDGVRRWIRETHICWGLDAEERKGLGLPGYSENTWRAGLQRLLLGYALPGKGERTFAGILPYDGVEGGDAEILGALLEFLENLFMYVGRLRQRHPLSVWADIFEGLMEAIFLIDEESQREYAMFQGAFTNLRRLGSKGGAEFYEDVGIEVIRSFLTSSLKETGYGSGFMSGGVTFCALLPMRSIPFRVIALVGMDHDAYPRPSRPLGFDLMARMPKRGDRSRRMDDRYLFLEAILSAKERLLIIYVGQSLRDDSPIPPSVLVSELMDYLDRGYHLPQGRLLDHIHQAHRLQAFSPAYFGEDRRFFSFSDQNFRTALRLCGPRDSPTPFLKVGLPEPEEEWKTLSVEGLCRFFEHPVRYLLRNRMEVILDEIPSGIEDKEAFDLNALDQYSLGETLLSQRLSGKDLQDFFPVEKASGRLPHGQVGECLYGDLVEGVDHFARELGPRVAKGNLEPLAVDLSVQGYHLTGQLEPITPWGLLHYRYATVKAKDRLRTWVRHLILNLLEPHGVPMQSLYMGLGKDKTVTILCLEETPEARETLGRLITLYGSGLTRPLHFFPESSFVYAEARLIKRNHPRKALEMARVTWMGTDYRRGESDNPYYALCFPSGDCLDKEFETMAMEVFGPLLGCQREP